MNNDGNRGSTIGALVGFLLFVVTGAIPSLVYGGYLAVLISAPLFGDTLTPNEASRYLILGGMGTGFIAVCVLYVVGGAFVGGLAEGAWKTLNRSDETSGDDPPEDGR